MKSSKSYKKLLNTNRALSLVFLSSLFLQYQGNAMLSPEDAEQESNREHQISSSLPFAVSKIHILNGAKLTIKAGARIPEFTTFDMRNSPENSLIIEKGVLNWDGSGPAILGKDIKVLCLPGQTINYHGKNLDLTNLKPEGTPDNNKDEQKALTEERK